MLLTTLRTLRVHQWSKNALLLVPLVTSHRIWPLEWLPVGLLAFFAFSLCASGTYVVNDLLDLSADRAHPAKRHRPIAAGRVSPQTAGALGAAALVAAAALAWPLGGRFLAVLGFYLVLTLSYSLWLKRVAVLDVVILATLYTVRVIAGLVIFHIDFSQWLLSFIVFLFLGLALLKRYTELLMLRGQRPAGLAMSRRGYDERDVPLVGQLGTSSAFVAVLVFALYINSEQVRHLYRHPDLLWLVLPVLLYWLGRMWHIAHHGQMDADPVLFALRDAVSYGVGVVILVIVTVASGVLG